MPRYWRDPDDDTVHLTAKGAEVDKGDVVVVPLEKWRRLVEIVEAAGLPWEQEEMNDIVKEVERD